MSSWSWWVWANIVAAVAWIVYWFRGANQGFCLHRWEAGRNRFLIGALTCSKCERVVYPERMRFRQLYRLLGRLPKENKQ